MPPNFSLNEAEIFSATGRSIEVYQTTLPSFFAASMSGGVMASAGGASARRGDANTVPSASAVEPFRTSRLESFGLFIAIPLCFFGLSAQRAAPVRRKIKPDLGASCNGLVGCRDDPQRRSIRRFDHIVAVGAEKDLARHHGLDGIIGARRSLCGELDIVL